MVLRGIAIADILRSATLQLCKKNKKEESIPGVSIQTSVATPACNSKLHCRV